MLLLSSWVSDKSVLLWCSFESVLILLFFSSGMAQELLLLLLEFASECNKKLLSHLFGFWQWFLLIFNIDLNFSSLFQNIILIFIDEIGESFLLSSKGGIVSLLWLLNLSEVGFSVLGDSSINLKHFLSVSLLFGMSQREYSLVFRLELSTLLLVVGFLVSNSFVEFFQFEIDLGDEGLKSRLDNSWWVFSLQNLCLQWVDLLPSSFIFLNESLGHVNGGTLAKLIDLHEIIL